MTKGFKGFQKGNKFSGDGYPKGHIPWNKGLPPEQQTNWKDGRSFKRGRDWFVQREKAYKRDGYKCRDCGRDDIMLQCHHLIDYNKTQDNRLSNLVTICVGCHAKRHKIGFKKDNQYWKKRKYTVTPNGRYKNER